MNLKLKIDKYGNLINLDTAAVIVPSNELFTDNFWETNGTTWKVNTTTQVTASTNDTMPVVVPTGNFTQNSRVDFYFRLHLPILDYSKKINIFEFSTGSSTNYDISFYKPANYDDYYIYVKGGKQLLPISSTEPLDIIGILSMCNIGSNLLAVFITLYTNENGTLTKIAENSYAGSVYSALYFGVSRDYHTNLSSYMVNGLSFDDNLIIDPNNTNNSTLNTFRYLNGTGLSEVWANIKNWVLAHIGNGTLTIQKNGTDVTTFSANSSSNATANITVPTKVSDLTNDSGFLTTASIPSKTSDLVNDSGFLTGVTWNDVTSKPSSYTPSSHTHTKSEITDFPSIPSKTSDLTNDSGFLTSHQSLSNYSTLANTVKSLSISGKTITVTPGSGSTYTLTTRDTVYTHPTTSGNKHIPSGGSSGQFLGWDSDGTAKWVNNPNTNTDTLVNQNVSTANNTYPVLIAHTANATANLGAKEAYFGKDIKINPSTGALYATKLYSNNVEVLTSHQSLSNYVTLNGAQTISATKSFSTAINTSNTSTSQRETWGITFTKTDTNGGEASALGVIQGKNSNDFYSILRLSNPRRNNKPTSGDGVNTGNCWGGIGVYFNFALNRGYPYTPNCDRWADSSNSDWELAATSWVRRYCETTKKFLTSHQSLSNYSTLTNTVKSLSISGKTITVTPGSGSAYTLTTQDTVYTHPTTAGNKHIPSGGSSGQILKYSSSGTAVWADASFTKQMVSIDTDSFNGASLPRTKTVTLTKSQLTVVTVDLTTLTTYLVKLTASNVFVVAIHTLVGTNACKQDSVNYGSILQQGATGRTRVVALIYPYNTSVEFTLAKVSGDGGFSSYSLTVYQ